MVCSGREKSVKIVPSSSTTGRHFHDQKIRFGSKPVHLNTVYLGGKKKIKEASKVRQHEIKYLK